MGDAVHAWNSAGDRINEMTLANTAPSSRVRKLREIYTARKIVALRPVHFAGFALDPIHLDVVVFGNEEVMSGLRRTIRMMAVKSPWGIEGAQLALNEFMRFKAKQGAWGMEHVVKNFDHMPAYSCWQMYGASLPHLQWFATRILAMVIGAGAPERFFSKLKWLKSPLRNRPAHPRTPRPRSFSVCTTT